MKRLVLTLVICLGCMGILGAQNVWKPVSSNGPLLGAASNGDLYAMGGYSGLLRSQDEGETWQVVLGYETGFSGYINQHCFAVSNEGRICVFNDNQQAVVYSDDNGATWQQTPSISSCAMPDKTGLCAPTNDIFVVWAENGEINFSLDGGETWEGWIPDFMNADNGPAISDLLVSENGDVYLALTTFGGDGGILHSTLSDIQNWEPVAGEGINIMDMAFDPEGNVVACGWNINEIMEFQHSQGFYLFYGTSLAIGDGGIVYTPQFDGLQAILSYSTDHGEHFTEIGEYLPLVDIAPGGGNARLFKGADNHLYFDAGGEYWKSVRDADHIRGNFPLENTIWVQFHRNLMLDWHPYYLGITGDTVVDGLNYHKLYDCQSAGFPIQGECFGGIRVEGDKWYFRSFLPNGFGIPFSPIYVIAEDHPGMEFPLYDFSLSVCDQYHFSGDEYGTEYLESVFQIDEMIVNGSSRKRFWFDDNCEEGEHYYGHDWIEGIGSNYGLLYPLQLQPLDGSEYHLDEVWQDGELIYRNPHNNGFLLGSEWYYEIENENGSITYQYMYQAGDTIVQDEPSHILVKINTLYDKGVHEEVTHEYVYERDGKLYWWNKTLELFTVLYDFEAEAGDSWEIKVGTESLVMYVDAVEEIEYEGVTYRVLHVSDADDLFSGNIVCGIGHLTSFFPERLMRNGDGIRVEGLRCYWIEDELVFKLGDEDCDAIYGELHGIEEGGPSTGSGTFAVYPNPTDGILFVETRRATSLPVETYRITNLIGQTLMTGQITAETQQINVSTLPKGMYFITFAGETRKFVVR